MALKGIRWPFRFGDAGGVRQAEGVEKVKTNLSALVLTAVKERVIRKNVGTISYRRVFRPTDPSSQSLVETLFRESAAKYEPRAFIQSVSFRTEDTGKLNGTYIDVGFVFRETGQADTASTRIS